MDMFEYFGLFREKHNVDRLTAAETRVIEYLFDKYLPDSGKVLDSSAGDGTFAFRFADRGYAVTAGDLLAEHAEELRSDLRSDSLADIYCASPGSLGRFPDGSFDVVISLGSVYHMRTRAERESFVRESLRVLSPDGYLAFTYMTPFAVTLGQHFKAMRTMDNAERLKAYRKLARVEKQHECDMFYGMTLDEMNDLSREYGLDILTVASTYSMFYNMAGEVDSMSNDEYRSFIEGQIATCEDAFIARYCMRGLYIGRKKPIDIFG